MARSSYIPIILCLISIQKTICQPCLSDSSTEEKQFFHLGKPRKVVISTRGRQGESRLVAAVFSIFAEEVLGYQTELLLSEDGELCYNTDTQLDRISTCQDPLCHNMDE